MAHPLSSHNGLVKRKRPDPNDPEYQKLVEDIISTYRTGLTYRQVAEKLGISPGQVAGVVHRMRKKLGDVHVPSRMMRTFIKDPVEKPKKATPQKPVTAVDGNLVNRIQVMRETPSPKTPRVRLRLVETDTEVTFAQLEHHHCRWPLGEVGRVDFRFCGRTRHSSGPYCADHAAVAGTKYVCKELSPEHTKNRRQPKFNFRSR